MWTVYITDQSTQSEQCDLDLHCPQKLLVLSSVRKELTHSHTMTPFDAPGKQAF